jgi:thioredoxin 2
MIKKILLQPRKENDKINEDFPQRNIKIVPEYAVPYSRGIGVMIMSVIVKCPACGAKNRIKEDSDIDEKPVCGKCKTPLIVHQAPHISHLTDASFDTYIQKSHKPVLVDFWAGWCHPCRVLAPILEAFANSQHSITVAKVDTEENPLLASRFQIFSIPTLVLFEGKKEVKRINGAVSLQMLESYLQPWIRVN